MQTTECLSLLQAHQHKSLIFDYNGGNFVAIYDHKMAMAKTVGKGC